MKPGSGGDPLADDSDTEPMEVADEQSDGEDSSDNGVPWAVERNSVKSDREMVQFYLREFVQDRESDFQRAVEDTTGYSTYLTDVREAAYLVAMEHPEEVAALLDDWGCEYD